MPTAHQSMETMGDQTSSNGHHQGGGTVALKVPTIKISIGLSHKVVLQQSGVLDGSCHVDVDLDGTLLQNDPVQFQQNVRQACETCAQAVNDMLTRSRSLHSGLLQGPAGGNGKKGAASEETAEQLMSRLLNDEGGDEAAGDEEPEENGAVATAKTTEKAAPAKAAPKPARVLDEDELAELRLARRNWIILGACAFVLIGTWWMTRAGGADPASVAARAMSGGKLEDRINAVVELSDFDRNLALTPMRQILAKTQEPAVRAAALNGLVKLYDTESLDIFLAALENPDANVRAAGLTGVKMFFDGVLPDNMELQPEDPPEKGRDIAKRIRDRKAKEKSMQEDYPAGKVK